MKASLNDLILEKFRFRSVRDNVPWASPRGTRGTLAAVFGLAGFTKGVEIGVKRGDYSKVLCDNIPNVELSCIDPYCYLGKHLTQEKQDKFYKEAKEKLSQYNVTFIKKFSMDALDDFEDGSLDFIYIDGNHEFDYVVQDIIYWSKKVKKGGIVACHDYLNFFRAGVVQAVDSYTHCNRITPWFVTKEQLPTAFWINR